MTRRDFLQAGACLSTTFGLSQRERLCASTGWRTFEVTTRVEVLRPSGTTRVWLPSALIRPTPYQRALSNTFDTETGNAKVFESKTEELGIVVAEYPPGTKPVLTVTSRVETRDWMVDLTG